MNEKTKHLFNSNPLSIEELKTIQGGSTVGILGTTLSGATAGVKLCSAGGPYAMAVCGIGGAALGAGFGVLTGA
ncbi:Blp family class II bacteriocin [Enterococcus sp. CSURQ0835]|uniref:Blp family class II bacteriocin n=1 Tax=Enterococcus sp. CSURQ0835 TaxID=2681394 RepID=UPI001356D806|nr:Blp family class II bacteriocin [Enterococcus sp. CSURQ0835]